MILVVGGAGYIGTHMVGLLLEEGYQVIVLDNLSRGNQDLLPGGIFIKGDLGDGALLDDLFKTHPVDAVMHFAAYALVGESVEIPLEYYQNNVSATVRLLDAMIRHQVKSFIFSSSAAVYGEPEYEDLEVIIQSAWKWHQQDGKEKQEPVRRRETVKQSG